jgi:hypothetical protein
VLPVIINRERDQKAALQRNLKLETKKSFKDKNSNKKTKPKNLKKQKRKMKKIMMMIIMKRNSRNC